MTVMGKLSFMVTGAMLIAGSALADGEFQQLSSGNQVIAKSLWEAQQSSGAGGNWSLDDIAAAGGNGPEWGRVFEDMKGRGLIGDNFRNLGEAVSHYQHQHNPAALRTETVITTGSGKQVTVKTHRPGDAGASVKGAAGEGGQGPGAGTGGPPAHAKGAGVTTAGGGLGPGAAHKGAGVTTAGGHGGGVVTRGGGRPSFGTGGGVGGHGNASGRGRH